MMGDGKDSHNLAINRRRITTGVVSLLVFVLVSVGLALLIGHLRLVAVCEKTFDAYTTASNQLQQLIDDNKDVAKITADDVATDDRSIVNDFQSNYKKAKELLKSDHNDNKCRATIANDQIKEAISGLASVAGRMQVLAAKIDRGSDNVHVANRNKKLADARSALSSTLQSVGRLASDGRISATLKSQLNRAMATARAYIGTDDVDNIESIRKQLDNIVNEVNEKLSASTAELTNIEAKVRAVASQPDAQGSYITSAVKILNTAGLGEVWGLDQMGGACAITPQQAASWIAAFCSTTPNNIYINNRLSQDVTNDSYFADAMRHEIGHYLIYRRCGTSDPASIGSEANAESTASSYAVLYLGANANTLNRAGDERYHMNQASDDAAARIHAGQCN